MTASVAADWLARGREHQHQRRPADAIPCFRRAAREDPRSPVPHFHLGEVLWQLGLANEAAHAWRTAAALDATFLAPRLALTEVALQQGDFAQAARSAAEAAALSPTDSRAQLTAQVARAAAGTPVVQDDLDAALAAHPDAGKALPLSALATLAEQGVAIPPAVATRAFTGTDKEALRRLAVVAHARELPFAGLLAEAHCALHAREPAPGVPLLWPMRTAGRALRVALLVPPPETAAMTNARHVARRIAQSLSPDVELLVVCAGDAQESRAALRDALPADTTFLALPAVADATSAKAIAARDCDVLIDAAGLAAASAAMLLARPARRILGVRVDAPLHAAPLVDAMCADADELVAALANSRPAEVAGAPLSAAALAEQWDYAVRKHEDGDLDAAAQAYRDILAMQPRHAPALHLLGVLLSSRGDAKGALDAFERALDAAPAFVDARVRAAEAALSTGDTDRALTLVQDGLRAAPNDLALLTIQGRVLLRKRDGHGAERVFRELLLRAPADAGVHFHHGIALARTGDLAQAARAYQRALTFRPDLIDADFNLGVIFEQQGNRRAAEAAYAHVIATDPRHAAAYKRLGDLLLAAGEIDRWLANFRAFESHCPKALSLAVYALEACQHAGDWKGLDRYLDGLRRDEYAAQDEAELAECLESLLYLLLFFDVEPALLLRLAQAYDAVIPKVYGDTLPSPAASGTRRPRIGYLSGDLRNHVMGKMMWEAISRHDRGRFDVFLYATSAERDAWTQRFEEKASACRVVAGLDDDAAAAVVAADELDLLVDLSTHTKGARQGVLARRPARVQMTHVASAGTLGTSRIDYKLTDRFCDLPGNQAFMLERLLVMEGCVYPFRRVEPAANHPFHRAPLGIPADAVVIGAFVNPLKLSRRCLKLWREVLLRIPRALVAFSPANPALRASYLRIADAAGIARDRLLFLPQGRSDEENQARYFTVDLVLDTLPFGGVNGTIEALAMGVPVVTLAGRSHGERTSFSILSNLGVSSTVAESGREYVDIAVRLATDASFKASVKDAIARGLRSSPLTDMDAHTRNLEAAYLAAIGR